MATSPQFTFQPTLSEANIWTANSNRDGSGTTTMVYYVSNFSGSRIEAMQIQATGSTDPGMVRLFIASGTLTAAAATLWRELPVAIVTASSTGSCFTTLVTFNPPVVLPTGSVVYASTEKANAFTIYTFGGNY